jgi:hypothetical protein
MSTIFISYRREETAGEARALFNELVDKLGEQSVFMDVDNIALGRDFRWVLEERLASCDLVLVLIGRNWADAKNESGQLRLQDSGDFVRLEISTALKRNIPVTPILVQGARIPAAERLPDDLKDLAYRNGFELSHNRWESDVRELIRRLALDTTRPTIVEPGKQAPATRRWWRVLLGGCLLVIAIAGGGLLYLREGLPHLMGIPQVPSASHVQSRPDSQITPAHTRGTLPTEEAGDIAIIELLQIPLR